MQWLRKHQERRHWRRESSAGGWVLPLTSYWNLYKLFPLVSATLDKLCHTLEEFSISPSASCIEWKLEHSDLLESRTEHEPRSPDFQDNAFSILPTIWCFYDPRPPLFTCLKLLVKKRKIKIWGKRPTRWLVPALLPTNWGIFSSGSSAVKWVPSWALIPKCTWPNLCQVFCLAAGTVLGSSFRKCDQCFPTFQVPRHVGTEDISILHWYKWERILGH